MRITELEKIIGGLSNPSKMPGLSYGTPADECSIGGILRMVKGSVCSKCYAHKGMYRFGTVQAAQYRRLGTMENLSKWTETMTELLSRKYSKKSEKDSVFRWHDSGDVRDMEHLEAIVQIAKNIPTVSFWLPTKEYKILRKFLRKSSLPSNLIVRISAPMIGQTQKEIPGTRSSSVGTGKGFQCPAYSQDGKCGDCRSCWDINVPNVDYPEH
jgi:hypothetical protein